MNVQEQISVLQVNEELDVTVTKKSKESKPPYSIIGNGKESKKFLGQPVVDTLAVFGALSPSQQKIVIHFRDHIEKKKLEAYYAKTKLENPNLIQLSKSQKEYEDQEIKSLLRANNNGKRLVEEKIIKKIKTNEYMLNPYMFIPHSDILEVIALWQN